MPVLLQSIMLQKHTVRTLCCEMLPHTLRPTLSNRQTLDHIGGMFAWRAPGALLFYWLSRLQPEIYPLMEKPPK